MTASGFLVAATLTFAGSVHCLGMCGPFVLATASGGAPRSRGRLALDQILLQLGKAATYAFLGAVAGALGGRVLKSPVLATGGRVFLVVAGLAIAAAGLALLGFGRRTGEGSAVSWAALVWQKLVGPLVTSRPPGFPLVVGMAMGFLPCPLIYAGLAGAAASGSPGAGAAILAGVALGTLPALTLAAVLGTAAFRPGTRLLLARAAGVLLVVTGLLTAGRGFGFRPGHSGPPPSTADGPACH